MYAVFTYQPSDQGVAWTALWYQNSELKYVDTSSWTSSPPGIGVANWARDAVEWEPGEYDVQIFVGTAWKATGSFSLTGEPPTFTPEATATGTAARHGDADAYGNPHRHAGHRLPHPSHPPPSLQTPLPVTVQYLLHQHAAERRPHAAFQ